MGGYVVAIVLAGLFMAIRPGVGEAAFYPPTEEDRIRLRQLEGVMPKKAWGFVPPVRHSHYDPAPWQIEPQPRTRTAWRTSTGRPTSSGTWAASIRPGTGWTGRASSRPV